MGIQPMLWRKRTTRGWFRETMAKKMSFRVRGVIAEDAGRASSTVNLDRLWSDMQGHALKFAFLAVVMENSSTSALHGVQPMRKMVLSLCAAAIILVAQFSVAQGAKAAPALKVGDPAPEFKLQYFDGSDLKNVNLSDYRGKKNVVLAFYVFAFTGG